MEHVINFLRRKGILDADKSKWLVKFDDGREFDIVELITEYTQPSEETKAFSALANRLHMISLDLVADDIDESISSYIRDVENFFRINKDWDTPHNRKLLSFPNQ